MEGGGDEPFRYLDAIPLPAVVLDTAGGVIGLNVRLSRFLDVAMGRPPVTDGSGLMEPADRERTMALLRGLESGGTATQAMSMVKGNGDRIRVQAHWSRLPGVPSAGYLGLFVVPPEESERGSGAGCSAPGAPEKERGGEIARSPKDPVGRSRIIHSIIFHDAKNRLGALQGYVSLLKESLPGSTFLPYLDKIEEIGSDIGRDLEVASILSHLGHIEPRWQDLREVLGRLASREPRGRISLEEVPPTLLCLADPLFPRVFSNLIENAERHGERVTTIRIAAREEEEGLVVSVEDDGVGVPADQKERIFELGFGRHTGYGLYLAREILAIGGFSIRETGEPGRGARFDIRIPRGRYLLQQQGPEEPDPVRIPAA